jgi:hypothetical protein
MTAGARLVALVLAVWAAFHPRAPMLADALPIARAWAQAVGEDRRAPVFGSRDEDLAVGAYYALRESWLTAHAVGDGGKSHGAWQEQSDAGRRDLLTQARAWLELLHEGARTCPAAPTAPLSGGCVAARKMAERRVLRALSLLSLVRGACP